MTLKKVRTQIEGNVGEYICVLHNMVNIFSFLLGSGKSTLANMLKEVLCNEYSIESDVFLEPIAEWSKNNLLSLALQCPRVYMFHLQTKIMTTFFNQRRVQTKTPVSIYERSLWSAKNVFQKLYYDEEELKKSEVETLDLLHDTLVKEKVHLSNPTVIIYIKLSPEECYRRKCIRTDYCDKDADEVTTLQQLHKLEEQYEEALKTCNQKKILMLDGTLDPLTLARGAANVLTSFFPATQAFIS